MSEDEGGEGARAARAAPCARTLWRPYARALASPHAPHGCRGAGGRRDRGGKRERARRAHALPTPSAAPGRPRPPGTDPHTGRLSRIRPGPVFPFSVIKRFTSASIFRLTQTS